MKTKLKIALIMIFAIFIYGCSDDDSSDSTPPKAIIPDLITPEFLVDQDEVKATFGAIAQSIIDGDMDKLISFHAYGTKFTEFKNGELRNGDRENEAHERQVFGSVTDILKFEANDLKVAVYGDVANLTFHSNFHLMFGDELVIVKDQITLLFVKTNDGWKMIHEHHSPLAIK